MDFATLEATVVATKQMAESYRQDPRFADLARSIAAEVLHDFGPINPDAKRDLHEVALRAAALMLASVYQGDAEISTLKAERDRYREIAEKGLMGIPRPLTVFTP